MPCVQLIAILAHSYDRTFAPVSTVNGRAERCRTTPTVPYAVPVKPAGMRRELHRNWRRVTGIVSRVIFGYFSRWLPRSRLFLFGLRMRKNPLRVLFAMEIKPFWQRCFACHGQDPNAILGGLNLTSREAMLLGGTSSKQVLVLRNAGASLLYKAICWSKRC